MAQKQAFFLSRLPKSVGVYLSDDPSRSADREVNIVDFIQTHFPHQAIIDIDVSHLNGYAFQALLSAIEAGHFPSVETDPETKKTAIRSLVKSITVASDAVLSIEYIVQTGIYVDSATGNRTPV